MDRPGWKGRSRIACALCIFIMLHCTVTQGAKILVVPVEGSHWINMEILIEKLKEHGHNITVFSYATTLYMKERPDLFEYIRFEKERSTDKTGILKLIDHLVQSSLESCQNGWTAWGRIKLHLSCNLFRYRLNRILQDEVRAIFENKSLLDELEKANFEILLTDPVLVVGPMLAHYLEVPLVYNVRWLPVGEAHFSFAPTPLSYIPNPHSHFTEKMNFLQRIENIVHYLIQQVTSELFIYPIYTEICHQHLGPDTDIQTVSLSADVWLMRADFVFEFPRPTMPNIVYIGGFQCKPARPLVAEFEEFVQNSGKHGLIVMSLGSVIDSLAMQITMEIAEAFAQVPQKVIWRYDGEIPPKIGNNTLLAKWIPQNDLLGHPNTRVFISHGGTNGIYEAIYHGVPVIGVPLIFDQFDNVVRLESRGAAKVLNVVTMHSADLLQALNEVINGTFYRDNMKKLSALHRDQPESPMERAVFWIEYVARHKGAGHLRSESYRLPWYVYHCVDVMVFLLSMLLMVTVLVVAALKKLCCMACRRKQKTE